MNIFYLDKDPNQAARWMVDRHVVKMILESAQLLSTAHRVLDGRKVTIISPRRTKTWELADSRNNLIYKATHVNHPSAIWVRKSAENYMWLFKHFKALIREYNYRYGKNHACTKLISALQSLPRNIPEHSFTQPPPAMDRLFVVSNDSVINYRNYYKFGKVHLHEWTRRKPPHWIKN